jgi:hypothetical protein
MIQSMDEAYREALEDGYPETEEGWRAVDCLTNNNQVHRNVFWMLTQLISEMKPEGFSPWERDRLRSLPHFWIDVLLYTSDMESGRTIAE